MTGVDAHGLLRERVVGPVLTHGAGFQMKQGPRTQPVEPRFWPWDHESVIIQISKVAGDPILRCVLCRRAASNRRYHAKKAKDV